MPEVADRSPAEGFERELDRVVDRLRGMLVSRLADPADRAFAASQALLALTAGNAGAHDLPRIADHAAGDQLAVIGHDFAAGQPSDEQYAAATALLADLRRSLP
ncbi:MAG: hypothetical protein F2793_09560 [Actinobacteria bacterium]|uniref:Unannotated protein n=1 Tax=freshwater metagenome TaxID=449393 RepID=A0A6J7ERX4_9ZZZZ|nr:hypothetical protein [Actinomycetota bacterium]